MSDPLHPELARELKAALQRPLRRVQPLQLSDGRRFWLKRAAASSARRLQAERLGFAAMAAAGMPVAAPLDLPLSLVGGADLLLLPDAGPSLADLPGKASLTQAERLAGFAAAGEILGKLHHGGLAHGRPAVHDMCWDGMEARFIDLEAFRADRVSVYWQARDLLVFAESAMVEWADQPVWLETALAGYAAAAPAGTVARVRRLARRLRPLVWAMKGLRQFKPESRRLRGIILARDHLAAWEG